jgi:hypothetical protein
MTSQARIRKALTVLEARRLELERVISDDLERKFLVVPEPVAAPGTTTTAHAGGYSLESTPTQVAGYSSITWLA